MKCCHLLGLGLAAVTDGFILGFQLADDPDISLTAYPYADRNAEFVDTTECQPGPYSDSDVLAVGVLNAVPQQIKANTDRIMYGIALWQTTDCDGPPTLLVGWRPNERGMQIANLFSIGLTIAVGSWVELDADNVYLGRRPEGGFVLDVRAEEYYTYEEGQWVVQSGEMKSFNGALDELTERAAGIYAAYTVAENSVGETNPTEMVEETRSQTVVESMVNENNLGQAQEVEIVDEPWDTTQPGGWPPVRWDESRMASPFPLSTSDLGQQRRPLLTSQQQQQQENPDNFDGTLARLAYNLGSRNPMVSMGDFERSFERSYPLMETYLQSQRNWLEEEVGAPTGWQQALSRAFRSTDIPARTTASEMDAGISGMRVEEVERQPQNQVQPANLQMLGNMFASQPLVSNPVLSTTEQRGRPVNEGRTLGSLRDELMGMATDETMPQERDSLFRLNMLGPPPNPNVNSNSNLNSNSNSDTNSRINAQTFRNLQIDNRQPQPDRFLEEYSPLTDYFSPGASDLQSPGGNG
ncbi:hypothetical protein TWF696_001216 [Orbilia brochopaga]|uniref:Uncharacterized protein n=1 Tax=Orbilia brochopaga TaxID=3140254 RepID=A0AAV9UAS6_9PEZI